MRTIMAAFDRRAADDDLLPLAKMALNLGR